jgi:hypothetical protein
MVVHGLARTSASMLLLGARLEEAGYRVVSFGYPSRHEPMDQLVERLRTALAECCLDAPRVHFVTHSMGGIVVWNYLQGSTPPNLGRVVMLAPPARGSEVIDELADAAPVRDFLGPAGSRLGTGQDDLPAALAPVDFEVGVIAGERSLNPFGSEIIPGPDDGKVAVERARVPGAADFLVLPAPHTFIMNRRDVAEETVRFLRSGRFGAPSDVGAGSAADPDSSVRDEPAPGPGALNPPPAPSRAP